MSLIYEFIYTVEASAFQNKVRKAKDRMNLMGGSDSNRIEDDLCEENNYKLDLN